MTFLDALKYCLSNGLIFAAYRLPHTDAIRLIVQKSPDPVFVHLGKELFDSQGFLVAPFEVGEQNPICFIRPDLNYLSTDYTNFDELLNLPGETRDEAIFGNGIVSKKDFMHQVEAIKMAISENRFEKAVISRIKVLERCYRSKLPELFQVLISSYTNAFVYVFNVGHQMWMGATPEPLLCSCKNQLETVSLAGTREYNAENLNIHNWCRKELIEQELVSRFVEDSFKKLNLKYTQKNGPYTKKAGNLIHLRTDYSIKFKEAREKLDELIKELHPTSAVCGLPKTAAMNFLKVLEKHNRSYYAGFLGPINLEERLSLFVNLRCMQILADRLILYVGAGITIDSDPEQEWDETEIKADTLLSVIHKI